MTFPAIPKTCSPQQAKFLRDRLSNTRAPYVRGTWRNRDKEPKEIRSARKLIERWEIAERKKDNANVRRFTEAEETARKAILFKPPEIALAAVEAYEKLCRDAKA